MELDTIGRKIYKGYCLSLSVNNNETFSYKGHSMQRFNLAFLERGSAVVAINGAEVLCTAPAIFCLNENDTPEIISQTDAIIKSMYFHPNIVNLVFNFENIRDSQHPFSSTEQWDTYLLNPFIYRSLKYCGFIKAEPEYSARLSKLFHMEAMELDLQRDVSWPCRSRSYMLELLILVSGLFEAKINSPDGRGSDEAIKISEIVSYLQTNYSQKITVSKLAKMFNTNRTTLNSRFKRENQISIIDYLIKLRIELASALLRDTRLSIEEITERVGFRSSTHFWRMFKKQTGVSPSAYRNENCWIKD